MTIRLAHAQELEALEIEAGIERGHDPAAPGGDLQRDLAEFTTLDACVHAHRVTDPVLADAVDALGYDTLVRDACRILQALKSKDGKFCSAHRRDFPAPAVRIASRHSRGRARALPARCGDERDAGPRARLPGPG